MVKLKILMEVLATYAQTLRRTLSPNMTPWPGRNCSVTDQMPDERRKTRIKRPASHTTLDGSFLIPRCVEALQENVYEVESIRVCGKRQATDFHGPTRISSMIRSVVIRVNPWLLFLLGL